MDLEDPLPHTYTLAEHMPKSFDWRNEGGKNYVTRVLNQHQPKYCGSCWLHAATATLSDRLQLVLPGDHPEVLLARQVVLNCGSNETRADAAQPFFEAGSCMGGNDSTMYEWVRRFGLPDDSCQEYEARDDKGCSDMSAFCRNCDPTPEGRQGLAPGCYPVAEYTRYFVKEWGTMETYPGVQNSDATPENMEHRMMAEIHQRGPISCSIDSSFIEDGKYHSGMILDSKMINATYEFEFEHLIEVVGWGEERIRGEDLHLVLTGSPEPEHIKASGGMRDEIVKYWIIKNSWGSFVGDTSLGSGGFYRFRRGTNSTGIESECGWATIDMEKSKAKVYAHGADTGKAFPSEVAPLDLGHHGHHKHEVLV